MASDSALAAGLTVGLISRRVRFDGAIGLIRVAGTNPFKLTGNHQVLAYGYEIGDDGSIRVHVYDPNHPNKNDVWVPIGGAGKQSTGEPVLGVVALD